MLGCHSGIIKVQSLSLPPPPRRALSVDRRIQSLQSKDSSDAISLSNVLLATTLEAAARAIMRSFCCCTDCLDDEVSCANEMRISVIAPAGFLREEINRIGSDKHVISRDPSS